MEDRLEIAIYGGVGLGLQSKRRGSKRRKNITGAFHLIIIVDLQKNKKIVIIF